MHQQKNCSWILLHCSQQFLTSVIHSLRARTALLAQTRDCRFVVGYECLDLGFAGIRRAAVDQEIQRAAQAVEIGPMVNDGGLGPREMFGAVESQVEAEK